MSAAIRTMPSTPPRFATDAGALLREQLLRMFREMVLYRRFEEAAARAYGQGRIHGFCHLAIGQEAIPVAAAHARQPGDLWITAYRLHTHAIAAGVGVQAAMDELFGRATGCSGGKGGSMHLYDAAGGFMGGWGIVGQQVALAAGLAFAQRYRKTGKVTVCFLGDGAMHQGVVHEVLNLSRVWELPVIYVVENNKYGMGTAVTRISALPVLHTLAEPYGIEHYEFDGMDVLRSYEALRHAFDAARAESRPLFLEAQCSRFRGHSMSDPGKYRTKEMLDEEKEQDPIPKMRAHLVGAGHATDPELDAIDREVKDQMRDVLDRANSAPWPDPASLERDVYVEP